MSIGDVLHVVDLPDSAHFFEERGACHFNDITMVPIQAKMINTALLTPEEVRWNISLKEYLTKGFPAFIHRSSGSMHTTGRFARLFNRTLRDLNSIG